MDYWTIQDVFLPQVFPPRIYGGDDANDAPSPWSYQFSIGTIYHQTKNSCNGNVKTGWFLFMYQQWHRKDYLWLCFKVEKALNYDNRFKSWNLYLRNPHCSHTLLSLICDREEKARKPKRTDPLQWQQVWNLLPSCRPLQGHAASADKALAEWWGIIHWVC